MSRRRNKTGTHSQDGPPVTAIIDEMASGRAEILTQLRNLTLALQDVEERTLRDVFFREWTPAYYVGRSQLFHVHNMRGALRATMFVGANTLAPVIMESDEVSPEIHRLVAQTAERGGVGMMKVPLTALDQVPGFMELVRVKWSFASRSRQKAAQGPR